MSVYFSFTVPKIEKNEMDGACSAHRVEGRRIQGFSGETWRKETTWELRRRWEGNIKMDLKDVGYGVMDWIELAQDREGWRTLVHAEMNLW